MTYDPDDQLEWALVLNEIKVFIEVSEKSGSTSVFPLSIIYQQMALMTFLFFFSFSLPFI